MKPMPRAGGVRAFSHLPMRDNPAPSTAPLREDSPRGEIAPIPPRSATPSTSGSPMAKAQDDAPPPEADSAPEDAPAPQDHADERPWYMPRITAQDLPPQDHPEDAHAPAPKPWENTTRSSGFDAAPHADRCTSSNGFSPSPHDLRDAFHSPVPRSPVGQAPAQDSSPTLPRGRIFEKRLPPGLRGQSSGQFQSLADKPEYHDLVYRPSSAENERHQDNGFFQNVADTRATGQNQSSPQKPQTISQSSKTGAQAPTSKPAQSAAPQRPPPAGQPRGLPLIPEDLEELYTKEGEERKPVGQLGIKGGRGFDRDGRPKTVCLYDGSDETNKLVSGKNVADAAAFLQAAQEYASNSEWVINISLRGWEERLKSIQRNLEGQGPKQDPSKGIDRIMIFDHGSSGSQEFGSTSDPETGKRAKNKLTPGSSAWKTITSCIKPGGDIVLMGCETGKEAWDETGPVKKRMSDDDGPMFLDALYYAADASRAPTIHAYDVNVRLRTHRQRPCVTAGRQITRSRDGFHEEGPDKKPETSPP